MNNEQNNNVISGMSFVPSMTGNNTSTNTNNLNAVSATDNNIPGANLSPVGGVSPSTGSSNSSMPNNNSLSPNLNTIMPEVSNNSLGNSQPINSSSPFDIGMTPSNDMGNTTIMSNPLGNIQNPSPTGIADNNMALNTTTNNSTPLTSSSPNNGQSNNSDNIVSVGKYLVHILLFSIPIIGTVMLIVKAFFDKKNINISNFAKAQLLLAVIILVISLVLTFALGSLIATAVPSPTITTYGM